MITSRQHDKWIVLLVGLLVIGLCQGPAQIGVGQQTAPGQTNNANPEGRAGAPVDINVFGNKLIITSDDAEALRRAAELVRRMTATPAGPGDVEVIQLKHANAVDAAAYLDKTFNGPKTATNAPNSGASKEAEPRGAGGDIPGSLPAGSAAVATREDRISVVADTITNSLVVKASPMDILAIRRLIEKQLDVEVTDPVMTHPPIRVKNLQVTDAYFIVRDFIRESLDNDNAFDGGSFASIFTDNTRTVLNTDPNGNPKGVILTMSYDKNSNSLIVVCPMVMYEDIKILIKEIEAAAATHKPANLFLQRDGNAPTMRFITRIREQEELDARPVVLRADKLTKELPNWFMELDTDNDGQVALYEWRKAGKSISEFKQWDRNNDGFITPEEALQKQRRIQKAQGIGTFNGFLGPEDMRDSVRGTPCRIYNVRMTQGRTYVIDLRSRQFDSFLRLEDSALKQLAQDDDSGGNLDARINFRCPRSGSYRVIATRLGNGQGAYTLSIREN